MKALLLADVILFIVMAAPISAWQRICGQQLVETVSFVCSSRGFYSNRAKRDVELFQDERSAKNFLGSHIGSRQRRRTGRIVTECCEKTCSFDIIESYCNPWDTVEGEDQLDVPVFPELQATNKREDKSVGADELFPGQEMAAVVPPVETEKVSSVMRRGEAALVDALEKMDTDNGENEPPERTEEEEESEEEQFALSIPTKKRRRVEGRKSRENSRDRGNRSEGKSRKRSGSREGGKSSRRKGKSSRSKKSREPRERSKRWEGLVSPDEKADNLIRNALRASRNTPSFKNYDLNSPISLYEKRRVDDATNNFPHDRARGPTPYQGYQLSEPDDGETLVALYNLAQRLARARRE